MVTDTFDNADALRTNNRGKRREKSCVLARNVGVADADRHNADEYVCVLEIRQIDLLDDEWAVQSVNTAAVLFMNPS